MSVATVARDILLREDNDHPDHTVCYGDLNLLHQIYDEAGLSLKNDHPMNKHEAVINGLDSHCRCRNPLFKKFYWRAHRGLARGFELVRKETEL